MSRISAITFGLVLACTALPAAAANAQDPDCEAHAAAAGREAGIPDGILPAIARVESARNGRAWPWTLNQGGKGSYHPTKEAALEQLADILATGEQNVDLGCMQLNWRWHSGEFPDAATMLDPVANTRYSARFLQSLKDRHGDWDSAVEAYHSNQPARGAAYGQKVATARDLILSEMVAGGRLTVDAIEVPAVNADLVPAEPATRLAAAGMTRGLLALSGRPLVARPGAGDLRQAGGQGGLFPGPGHSILSASN